MDSSNRNFSVDQVAAVFGVDSRHVRRLCESGKLPSAKKTDGVWSIPGSADGRLCGILGPEELTAAIDLLDIPARKRDDALRKLGLLRNFESFVGQRVISGYGRVEAVEEFAAANNLSVRVLYKWQKLWRRHGLVGLVDRRGSQTVSSAFSPEAFRRFKELYLDPRQPSVKSCWLKIKFENSQYNRGWAIPGLRRCQQIAKDDISEAARVLWREGQAAYEAKCAPYIQKDMDSVGPNEVWIGDHHQCNIWVRHQNRWVRPWLTAWLDMRTRVIVGVDLNISPNQTTILRAMRRAVERYGPPSAVKIDNGKDYSSQVWTGQTKTQRLNGTKLDTDLFTGIYGLLGINVSFSIPYHPQSKAIERFFDTVDMQLCKSMSTYCGKSADRRPENLFDKMKNPVFQRQAPTLTSFGDLLEKYFDVYHNTVHCGDGMEGRTPNQVMALRTSKRVVKRDVLDLLFAVWSPVLKVGKNGVRFQGMYYGQYLSELAVHFGKSVRVSYNPDDIRCIQVYDAQTLEFLCSAEQNKLIGYGQAVSEAALREAMKQKSKAKKAVKAARGADRARFADLSVLAIDAMADAAEGEPDDPGLNIRPVRTALDSQAAEVKRGQVRQQLKKAAGAESDEHFSFDHSAILREKEAAAAEQKAFREKLFGGVNG